MERQPEVSVICNTYNHEQYVRDALEGFLIQETGFIFEVLIHDDASTDNTAQILREYEAKRPDLFKVIYETENQYSKHDGTISRLQSQRAKGKYIAACEGDDYWSDPKKLQKQYDFMESHPEYTLCGCSADWLNMITGKIEAYGKTPEDRDFTLDEIIRIKRKSMFPFVSFFVRADIWKSQPRWGFPVGDYPMLCYAAMKGKVHMLADTMCVYRWYSKDSWSVRSADQQKRSEICDKMISGLENMDRDTEYRFTESIQKKILWERYLEALMNQDFKTIRSSELISIYKKRSLKNRLSDRVRCQMPVLFRLLQRILKKSP